VLRGVARGNHKKAIALMTLAGGCLAATNWLDKALARPPLNPATLSKLYSDKSACRNIFVLKMRRRPAGLPGKALAYRPGKIFPPPAGRSRNKCAALRIGG